MLQTPCVASQTLSQITGAQVYLKFENLQFTASFKERGACNRLQLLSSAQKARQHAYALAEQQQLSFIHPFDDEAVATAGQITSAVVRERVDDLLLVDEGDIEQAVLMLLEIEKTLVEGAGAAGLAALLRHGAQFRGKKVGLILSGGNIDPMLLAAIIERGMARSGRLARIKVSARDVPGVLAQITATVAQAGANIEEVHHQRAFTMLAAQNVEIEFVLQTRNQAHVEQVLQALQAQGMEAVRV